jgi:hypothetical protein
MANRYPSVLTNRVQLQMSGTEPIAEVSWQVVIEDARTHTVQVLLTVGAAIPYSCKVELRCGGLQGAETI